MTQTDFTVLAVCTGNVCRSPAVERLLRAAFADLDGLHILSGGLDALVGRPVSAPMAHLLRARGVAADDFRAQSVTAPAVGSADLVLTATQRQRGHLVSIAPAAVRRSFTLREFARIASGLEDGALDEAAGPGSGPVERFAALVPLAAAHRYQVERSLDDVPDPYGRSEAAYQEAFGLIADAVDVITGVVRSRRSGRV